MAILEAHEKHQELIDELIAEVEAYNPEVDRELIVRAFRFAAAAHEGQQRRSGEDFILHPIGAARICAQLRLDEQTIAAALLHDVVEDTETDIDDVRSEFGDEIAKLVEGVTKLTRVHFQSREQAEAENYRKLIVAMAEDVRVILIKLGDRLHNLREIEYLGKQKQVQKAKETLEVYAPLAHRPVSTRSSGSSRTSRSRRSTRGSTRRSRRWSPSGAPTARSRSQRRPGS
jgi:GTP pyrophosphokinase